MAGSSQWAARSNGNGVGGGGAAAAADIEAAATNAAAVTAASEDEDDLTDVAQEAEEEDEAAVAAATAASTWVLTSVSEKVHRFHKSSNNFKFTASQFLSWFLPSAQRYPAFAPK